MNPLVAASISEQDFTQNVRDLARLRDWRTYHTLRSKGSEPGFPDLVMVRKGHLIVAELKAERGRVRPDQQAWLDDLSQTRRIDVELWRPSDWRDIERRLT